MYVVVAGERLLPVGETPGPPAAGPAGGRAGVPDGDSAGGRAGDLAEVPAGGPDGMAGVVREVEAARGPRWVWADTREAYPPLLERGVRVARCHDLALTEGLLLAFEGRYGEARSA
ncbi:hypothetical protein AB0J43_50825, partial [Nonomuraea fuscirosea]